MHGLVRGIGLAWLVGLASAAWAGQPAAETQQASAAPAAASSTVRYGLPAPKPKAAGSLRLATYNVENLFDDRDDPSLKDLDDDMASIKPTQQLQALAETIRRLDADVLALQEVESYDVLIQFRETYLKDLGYKFAMSLDAGDPRGIECAVLSRFPLTTGQVWPRLPLGGRHPDFTDGGSQNWWAGQLLRLWRSPLRVDVEVTQPRKNTPATMMTLFVMQHRSPRELSYWRDAEARAIVGFVEEVRKSNPDQEIAVLGMFNDLPDSTPLKIYSEAGFADTLAARVPGSPEFVTHESGRVLDYIMLDKHLQARVVEGSAGVLGTPARPANSNPAKTLPPVGYASDHYPVYVDLKYAPAGSPADAPAEAPAEAPADAPAEGE